jgi:hypothetical protein
MTTQVLGERCRFHEADQDQLAKLVNAVALSDRTITLFAIAPEVAPNHPVVEELARELQQLEEPFQFLTLHYSDDSLFSFLHRLDQATPEEGPGRRVVMAFGLEQLRLERLQREIEQLNLGRERIFQRNLVLVFWLNHQGFLQEFQQGAPDFWDWQGGIAQFTTRPPVNPLLYPYLEWLIAENSHLKVAGVMQVNRQVDIFLDQIYVSLQGESRPEPHQSGPEGGMSEERTRLPRSPWGQRDELGRMERLFRDEFIPSLAPEMARGPAAPRTVDLAEAVCDHRYSVILGDPGAGKTTLLRYLARHFALAQRDQKAQVTGGQDEDLGAVHLPILLRVADYAERLAKQPKLSLVQYLRQFYHQGRLGLGGEEIAALLLRRMGQGDCLLLLDGLDEVFDRANRAQVVQQIQKLVQDYPANRFVVTSRVAGYGERRWVWGSGSLRLSRCRSARLSSFCNGGVWRSRRPNDRRWRRRCGNGRLGGRRRPLWGRSRLSPV